MQLTRFIKSFSKGQITIPKEFRDRFGIGDEFWLKLSIEEGKLVAEPVGQNVSSGDYAQKLLKVKGDWFSKQEYQEIRAGVSRRLKLSSV